MTDTWPQAVSDLPVIAAPMAGGPSTVALVAEVGRAGGVGFIAAGYLSAEALDRQLGELAAVSERPYGVNLFLPSTDTADPTEVSRYTSELADTATELGVSLGQPEWSDDALAAKLVVLERHRPAFVSLTFAAPDRELVERLHRTTGARIIATVTSPEDALQAVAAGVDLLCAQGFEAGGHRGLFVDDPALPAGGSELTLLALVQHIRAVTDVPVIATGGLMDGTDIAVALDAGAVAVQLGTAFLCTPEAGTSAVHRRALLERRYARTVVTRAFTGRSARALENAFAQQHSATAPAAYPQVHYLTRPLRAAAAQQDRPDLLHLWAGTGWQRVTEEGAFALVRGWAAEAGL